MQKSVLPIAEFEGELEELRRLNARRDSIELEINDSQVITWLPRGGCLIKTKLGYVQVGIPPETIKDTIILELRVPHHYVISSQRFDKNYCINVADFEFPAYFNFFIKKKKIVLICSKEGEAALRIVFQETLLGPKSYERLEEEFPDTFLKTEIPNLANEVNYFAKGLTIDTLIDFVIFDQKGEAHLKDNVVVKNTGDSFIFVEDGKEIAIVPDKIQYNDTENILSYRSLKDLPIAEKFSDRDLDATPVKSGFFVESFKPFNFKPPLLGVTFLGASDGFDARGSVAGLILWINGRATVVDPPPFSINKLSVQGVSPNLIDYMIITHCHGDRDAGALQLIFEYPRIEVITTPTIMNSFLRKTSAITGMDIEQLKQLIKHRPVRVGTKIFINGAAFKFGYSLHSIPAIHFTIFLQGKSIYFSGDTLYDPAKYEELVATGVISKARKDSLLEGGWNSNIILHEAGRPPLHTPVKIFETLPKDIKEKIYLCHISAKEIPKNVGLKVALTGIQNTISAANVNDTDTLQVYRKLNLLSSIDMFSKLPFRAVKNLLEAFRKENFKSGEVVLKQGSRGDKFYVIVEGIAKISNENTGFLRYYQVGEYFGEACLKKDFERTANVVAATDITLLSIRAHEFEFIVGEESGFSRILDSLQELQLKRKAGKHLIAMNKNSVLRKLKRNQTIHFESIIHQKVFTQGSYIIKQGDEPNFGFLIQKGEVELITQGINDEEEASAGAFVGDFQAMLTGKKSRISAKAVSECTIFIAKKDDLLDFLNSNPKYLFIFSNAFFFD